MGNNANKSNINDNTPKLIRSIIKSKNKNKFFILIERHTKTFPKIPLNYNIMLGTNSDYVVGTLYNQLTTLLMVAVACNRTDIVDYLIKIKDEAKIDFSAQDLSGHTAIYPHYCSDLTIFEKLWKHCDFKLTAEFIKNDLHHYDKKIIKFILSNYNWSSMDRETMIEFFEFCNRYNKNHAICSWLHEEFEKMWNILVDNDRFLLLSVQNIVDILLTIKKHNRSMCRYGVEYAVMYTKLCDSLHRTRKDATDIINVTDIMSRD